MVEAMTDADFNVNFRTATGLNFMTADWVRSFAPDTFIGKVYFFIKTCGKISLLYTIYKDTNVVKFGRFDNINNSDNKEINGYAIKGRCSELVNKLLELIFKDKADSINYILSDTGEYVLLDNGEKIII